MAAAFGQPKQATERKTFEVPETVTKGDRHNMLYRFARSQKARNVSLDVALVGCHAMNEQQCEPPIEKRELDSYLRRVWEQADTLEFLGDTFKREKGKIVPRHQGNLTTMFEQLRVEFSYDTFSQKVIVSFNHYTGPYDDKQRNRIWLAIDKRYNVQVPGEYFDIFVQDLAHAREFHPVRDYLDALVWDKIARLDEWLIAYAKAGDSAYTRAVSGLMLESAVRRIYQPGVKFDEMVVLESEQGTGKSSVLRALCKLDAWFSDDLPLNVDSKQIIERTRGKWLIEAAELSGMHKSKVEHLKSMMSRQFDGPVRMAYARLPIEEPRQFILVGTTNAHVYLSDPTGERRFWPVHVKKIDVDAVKRDRDQLWAEAVMRHKRGDSIRLSPELYEQAALQQERRRTVDPWEPVLEEAFSDDYARVLPCEIWKALGISTDRQDARMAKRVAEVMQRLGFRRMTVWDSENTRSWVVYVKLCKRVSWLRSLGVRRRLVPGLSFAPSRSPCSSNGDLRASPRGSRHTRRGPAGGSWRDSGRSARPGSAV